MAILGCAPPSDAELQTIAAGIGGLREDMSRLCFGPPGPQRTRPSTPRFTSGDGVIVTTTATSSDNEDFQSYLNPQLIVDKNVGELSHSGRVEGSSNSSVSNRADWERVMVTSGSSSRRKDLSFGQCAMYCIAAMYMLP